MGQAAIPASRVDTVALGTTTIVDPLLMLSISGVVYPNGYRVLYSGGYRNFFASTDALGNINLECQAIAFGADLPEVYLGNVEVLIIG